MTTITAIEQLRAIGDRALYTLAFLVLTGPLTQRRLEALTGYSENTQNKALVQLAELRLAARATPRGAWHAATAAKQLALGELIAEPSKNEAYAPLVSTRGHNEEEKHMDPPPPLGQPQASENEAYVHNPSTGPVDNSAALDTAGIFEPARSRLAALPHVNPDYIRAHARQVAQERLPAAVLIYRIEHAWREPPHPDRCQCEECRHKYTAWNRGERGEE